MHHQIQLFFLLVIRQILKTSENWRKCRRSFSRNSSSDLSKNPRRKFGIECGRFWSSNPTTEIESDRRGPTGKTRRKELFVLRVSVQNLFFLSRAFVAHFLKITSHSSLY